MVANYFLGAVVLILTTDIVFGADLCLCSGDIYRYSSDCCSVHSFTTKKPIWELGITQRPILDMWWTERPIWYGRTTSKMPIFERSTTRRLFWDLWTTRKPIWNIRPTSKTPAWDIWTTKKPIFERSTTRRPFWDLWTTRKQIWDIGRTSKTPAWEIRTTKKTNWGDDEWLLNRPTTRSPYLDPYDSGSWSTTHGSDTTDVAVTIGASVGGVTAFAFICCLIAACARVKRGRQGAVMEHHQPSSLPRNVGILIVFRRIFVWRCQVRADTEHLISNPQTGTNAYNQEPVTPVAPPPYTPASPSVSPPPYSEYI